MIILVKIKRTGYVGVILNGQLIQYVHPNFPTNGGPSSLHEMAENLAIALGCPLEIKEIDKDELIEDFSWDDVLSFLGFIKPAEAISLCEEMGISLMRSEDEEILNRWVWIDTEAGKSSSASFSCKEQAAMDAIKSLKNQKL